MGAGYDGQRVGVKMLDSQSGLRFEHPNPDPYSMSIDIVTRYRNAKRFRESFVVYRNRNSTNVSGFVAV